jgi:phosphopantetheinyl transferase (holo-ACP synthase)|tara:strand:- start:1774 stop:2526 length:753 start_codon:yes stop_codon:yes gene_type:complete
VRKYKIGKTFHPVFEDEEEIPENIRIIENWREGELGDWIKADDGNVIQALRVNKVMNQGKYPIKYIGTCTGTYLCRDSDKMDTEKRENIYTFSARASNNTAKRIKTRNYLTANEAAFSKFIANGFSPQEAYKKAFGTENNQYAKMKSAVLVKQERVVSAVKEEVDEVLKGLGVDLNYLIKGVKLEAENADRSNDRLKAFSMLWDAAEVIPKQKVTQLTGAVFQGFSDNMLESAKRKPELTGEVANAPTKE